MKNKSNSIGINHNENGIKKRNVVVRQFYIDEKGEDLLIVKSTDVRRALYLKLFSETKKRLIGTVTRSTKTIFFKRKRNVHLFRKINGYGFNDFILRNQDTIDWIDLSDDCKCHWKIPVKYVLDNGKYLTFSKVGFETQRFLSLEELEQFKIHEYENRRF